MVVNRNPDGTVPRPPKMKRKKQPFKWYPRDHMKKKKVNRAMVEGQSLLSDY